MTWIVRKRGTAHVFGLAAVCLGIPSMAGPPAGSAPSPTHATALPALAQSQHFDFEQGDVGSWTVDAGTWKVEDMQGAPSGARVLVQRGTAGPFPVIVAPAGPFSDVDVTVRFKPISGAEDAAAGIVFRYADGRYYVVRANALEDNFGLYAYDKGRRQIAGASVSAPRLGAWHTLRVVMVGDRIQGYLNGVLLIDHHDKRFAAGRVGLWTKADSVTAFDDLVIQGVPAGK